jgi:hypothetical protein
MLCFEIILFLFISIIFLPGNLYKSLETGEHICYCYEITTTFKKKCINKNIFHTSKAEKKTSIERKNICFFLYAMRIERKREIPFHVSSTYILSCLMNAYNNPLINEICSCTTNPVDSTKCTLHEKTSERLKQAFNTQTHIHTQKAGVEPNSCCQENIVLSSPLKFHFVQIRATHSPRIHKSSTVLGPAMARPK